VLGDAAAGAEAAVVPGGVAGKTPGQIRAAIGRAVVKAGPDAARRRREEAEKDPRVQLWREDAGTAAICGYGSLSNLLCELGQLSSFCYITVGSFWCSGQTGTRSPNATENAFMAAFQP